MSRPMRHVCPSLPRPGPKPASVVRVDEPNDLAVLKLDQGVCPALPIASRRVRSGRAVAAIGVSHIEVQGFSPKGCTRRNQQP